MWNPAIQAAEAFDTGTFVLALGELDYDDPFTAIVSYDAAFEQPWSRVDVEREIVSVTFTVLPGVDRPVPVALSNEGDVYTLGDEILREKLVGAGIQSEDADGRGQAHAILGTAGGLVAIGAGAQLYRKPAGGAWQDVSPSVDRPAGYEPVAFGHIAEVDPATLLVDGILRPDTTHALTDPQYQLTDQMSVEEMLAMMERQSTEATTVEPATRLYAVRETGVVPVAFPDGAHVRDLFVEASGQIWIVGVAGLIMRGTLEDGFERLGFPGDRETLLSATRFRDEIILASDYALHRFDGHRLTPLKPVVDPTVNRGVPVPLRLQGFDDAMVYFDRRHGALLWDGTRWSPITMPDALRQRPFTGLQTAEE